ncbi:hypothetical protein [Paraclostridium bifermentans]|uniref:hypothetical protein n=1 Tax=Paraclostridium bifermentans TaxID=1490 RepID=UPI00359C3323
METEKTKPIHKIILTMPIYLGILYRSYNFEINKGSIILTLTYLSIIFVYLYLNNKKL